MDEYKVNIPVGKSGKWEIKKFTVSEEQAKFDMFRSIGRGGRYTPAGTYTSLTRNGNTIMSDTPDEISDHFHVISHAKGNVLLNGLGLGMVLGAILNKPEVTFVTVIEQSEDVISLVSPSFVDYMNMNKLNIIHADAFEYKPEKGKRFDIVWHDIWDDICVDNLPEMTKLHRKYGRIADWQGSWSKEILEWKKREEKRHETEWNFTRY
jgi:hypothetical protein